MADDELSASMMLRPPGFVPTLREQFAMYAPAAPDICHFGAGFSPMQHEYKTADGLTDFAAYEAAKSDWLVRREAAWRWAYADAMMKAREAR